MERITTLYEAFLFTLKRLYTAEQEIHQMMPYLVNQVSPSLGEQFQSYQDNEHKKMARFQEVFAFLDEKPTGKKNQIITDLLHETKDRLLRSSEIELRDRVFIDGMQIISEYKISDYKTCHHFANELQTSSVKELISEILEEENRMDQKLRRMMRPGAGARSFAVFQS